MSEDGARAQRAADLLCFLRTIQKPGSPIGDLDEGANLVVAGLIDSLAVLQIAMYLEDTYGINFVMRGIDPGELMSVAGILDLIERATG